MIELRVLALEVRALGSGVSQYDESILEVLDRFHEGGKTMADITKCNNEECKLKEKCYRYLAESSRFQSYFVNPKEDCEELDYNEFIEA